MDTLNFFHKIFYVLIGLFLVTSCTTEDILPAIELTASDTNFSEDNGSVTVSAKLISVVSESVTIPLIIRGDATLTNDYEVSSSEIVISSGNDSGSIIITGVQDTEIEGSEKLIITSGGTSGFLVLGTVEISLLDDDSDSDSDGVLDVNDNCPFEGGEFIDNNGCPVLGLGFIINEVHYDPEADLPGDANGDGTRSALEDEFIEFFNSGPELDISGYTISDSDAVRHTFPTGTILPINGVIVVFGGGTPTGNFGSALVQTASEGQINMSNSGDIITLSDASGASVLTFDIEPLSNNPNESYTRNPDLTGGFEQHSGITESNGTLYSPGTKLDGTSF